MPSPLPTLLIGLISIAIGGHYSGLWSIPSQRENARWECHPFLPKLFIETPPPAEHPRIRAAALNLDHYLVSRFARSSVDSLSVAVVTSNGPIYERNFGVLRGNETDSEETTSQSLYRIASTAKLFPVLEAFILEQKGALSWDDPVTKYIPDFRYRLDGFNPSMQAPTLAEAPITLVQLATHLSGLGRDWPPGVVADLPHSLRGAGPPPTNGHPFPSHESLLQAIAQHRLTSPPQKYPAYSNTGTALLSMAVVNANRMKFGRGEPETFAELVKRDIFEPLGMNGSDFLVTEANKKLVVVPNFAPEVADQDFLDAMNPAAGQFSSLSDLITFTQTLLNPHHSLSRLSESSLDKWLHPVHSFEEDDWTELGMMWEIIKAKDSNGRLRRIYWKLGAMAGYHAALAIHPGTSYGVVVLMTGAHADAAKFAYDTFATLQPVIDSMLSELATELYAGRWSGNSGNESSTAEIRVRKGTVWLDRYVIDGVDVLKTFGAKEGKGLALRNSGRRDEFRVDTGFPGYNGLKHMGCYPYWNGQDLWGVRNDAAVNVITFEGSGSERTMHVPSLNLTLYQ